MTFLVMTAFTLSAVLPTNAQEITISEGIYLGWAPFYVADAQNLWKKHGLTVKVAPFTSGRLCLDAILGGGAVFGTVAETPVVHAALKRMGARVIAHMNIHEVFDLTAVKGIQRPEDLRGTKIGYLQGANSQFYLHRLLERASLTWKDVTAITMNPPDMITSIIKGDIDSFVWTEPYMSHAVEQGRGKLHVLEFPRLYTAYACIVTMQKTIDNQPEILVKGLRALMEAVEFIHKEPEKAIALAAKKTQMDFEIAKKEWQQIHYGIELNPKIIRDMEEQAQWAIDTGLTRPGTKMPDFSGVVVVPTILEMAKRK
jgi:NitT/TauT family transport system substrate-binding protein